MKTKQIIDDLLFSVTDYCWVYLGIGMFCISVIIVMLTHWSGVTHICVGNLTIIGSDNGLSPGRSQAIIWTNAGILLIGPWGTNFSEILIEIQTFSCKKIYLKISSAKCQPFCLGLNVLSSVLAWMYAIIKRVVTDYCMLPSQHYRKSSSINRTKSQHLNVSHLVLQLSFPNPLKPGIKSRIKVQLEQRWQAMLQLHLSDQQFYCL